MSLFERRDSEPVVQQVHEALADLNNRSLARGKNGSPFDLRIPSRAGESAVSPIAAITHTLDVPASWPGYTRSKARERH